MLAGLQLELCVRMECGSGLERQQNHKSRKRTLCPSGLRGWTQLSLAPVAWAQTPQVSFVIERALA